MPWVKENGRDKFIVPRFTPPGPLPPGVKEFTPPAHAQRQREIDERRIWVKRLAEEWIEFHKVCPRHACKRNGACQSPTIACHDEYKEVFEELFYRPMKP